MQEARMIAGSAARRQPWKMEKYDRMAQGSIQPEMKLLPPYEVPQRLGG
jgi:hypothetical protein